MSKNPENKEARVNLRKLRPYGDIMDDGTIQLCFTLPVEPSAEAREAAVQLCEKMGLEQIKVATMEKASEGFAVFVIYGNMKQSVDFTAIRVLKVEAEKRSRDELDAIIQKHIGRKLIVLGACTGYDAHTVGIDAIMNMKGFAGDYGLERYQWLDARNLGAQVLNDDLLRMAIREKADAILVSKVVTQHNIHIRDLKDLLIRAEKMGIKDQLVFVAGGPRVTHPLALECGFDAGFGVGTKPSDVASYIVEEFLRRREKNEGIPNPLKDSSSLVPLLEPATQRTSTTLLDRSKRKPARPSKPRSAKKSTPKSVRTKKKASKKAKKAKK